MLGRSLVVALFHAVCGHYYATSCVAAVAVVPPHLHATRPLDVDAVEQDDGCEKCRDRLQSDDHEQRGMRGWNKPTSRNKVLGYEEGLEPQPLRQETSTSSSAVAVPVQRARAPPSRYRSSRSPTASRSNKAKDTERDSDTVTEIEDYPPAPYLPQPPKPGRREDPSCEYAMEVDAIVLEEHANQHKNASGREIADEEVPVQLPPEIMPPPPRVPEASWNRTGRRALQGQDASPHVRNIHDQQSPEDDEEAPPPPPSKGSKGHPFSCAPSCKYFRRPRGCKDGLDCTHCHLCEKPKPIHRYAAKRYAAKNKRQREQLSGGAASRVESTSTDADAPRPRRPQGLSADHLPSLQTGAPAGDIEPVASSSSKLLHSTAPFREHGFDHRPFHEYVGPSAARPACHEAKMGPHLLARDNPASDDIFLLDCDVREDAVGGKKMIREGSVSCYSARSGAASRACSAAVRATSVTHVPGDVDRERLEEIFAKKVAVNNSAGSSLSTTSLLVPDHTRGERLSAASASRLPYLGPTSCSLPSPYILTAACQQTQELLADPVEVEPRQPPVLAGSSSPRPEEAARSQRGEALPPRPSAEGCEVEQTAQVDKRPRHFIYLPAELLSSLTREGDSESGAAGALAHPGGAVGSGGRRLRMLFRADPRSLGRFVLASVFGTQLGKSWWLPEMMSDVRSSTTEKISKDEEGLRDWLKGNVSPLLLAEARTRMLPLSADNLSARGLFPRPHPNSSARRLGESMVAKYGAQFTYARLMREELREVADLLRNRWTKLRDLMQDDDVHTAHSFAHEIMHELLLQKQVADHRAAQYESAGAVAEEEELSSSAANKFVLAARVHFLVHHALPTVTSFFRYRLPWRKKDAPSPFREEMEQVDLAADGFLETYHPFSTYSYVREIAAVGIGRDGDHLREEKSAPGAVLLRGRRAPRPSRAGKGGGAGKPTGSPLLASKGAKEVVDQDSML